ncbi:phosphoenolpyruvate--protein phosphotransferase [Arthrobacter castelli]|uniref:phosphoenolpyruvate--protein phosphotransferase n=1 Tax=Arthrobacter castelli TaxID=271431 RepID=UPI000412FB4D|nr:phosphoenolpyruvate--protein phosphotransferase [Arthrobacter castelli]
METINGVGVSPGRVIGPVLQMPPPVQEPAPSEKLDPEQTVDQETQRLKTAATAVQAELKSRAATATGDAVGVLEATSQMAADPMLLKAAGNFISTQQHSAERAVWDAGEQVAETLKGLGGYMAERAADVLDVRARIVAELRGMPAPGIPVSDTPFILAAQDLAPADTATLDPAVVVGLATSSGGPQSHTAILARALGLPAAVAARGVDRIADGSEVYLDGATGEVITSPDDVLEAKVQTWREQSASLTAFEAPATTADGHHVPLLANVGNPEDAAAAAAAGAEGVGLLRTEFCFLGRDTEPDHQEQVEQYRAIFDAFAGCKVVIRTLDAGADKPLPFLTNTDEPNPALGVRGFRTDMTSPGVLERQLTAIAAAAEGSEAEVWVMAPMISTRDETAAFAALCRANGLKTPGIMVEVPSAAVVAGQLLEKADFASLGTNDLTQYTMAADRQVGELAGLNDPWQPAVLRLVDMTVDGGKAAGGQHPKPVGVCGEAAADPALAVVMAGLGVSTLSMTARALGTVATVLKSVTLSEAQDIAAEAAAQPTAAATKEAARSRLPVLDELGL